jgi:hypothetical protein
LLLNLHSLSACADFAGWVRKCTYPPTFHYITDEQLRSTMWRLAYHSRELREPMTSPEQVEAHRAEVLHHLEGMEHATLDWPTNHPLVDANRSTFLRDIKTARQAITREPGEFFACRIGVWSVRLLPRRPADRALNNSAQLSEHRVGDFATHGLIREIANALRSFG